jgi:hypothetical protein
MVSHRVEASDDCFGSVLLPISLLISSTEYYRAVLLDANPNLDSYDVEYGDGEEGLGLCRHCVRPFKPYAVGEIVEARIGNSEGFFKARILKSAEDDWYEVSYIDMNANVDQNKKFVVSSRIVRRFR